MRKRLRKLAFWQILFFHSNLLNWRTISYIQLWHPFISSDFRRGNFFYWITSYEHSLSRQIKFDFFSSNILFLFHPCYYFDSVNSSVMYLLLSDKKRKRLFFPNNLFFWFLNVPFSLSVWMAGQMVSHWFVRKIQDFSTYLIDLLGEKIASSFLTDFGETSLEGYFYFASFVTLLVDNNCLVEYL